MNIHYNKKHGSVSVLGFTVTLLTVMGLIFLSAVPGYAEGSGAEIPVGGDAFPLTALKVTNGKSVTVTVALVLAGLGPAGTPCDKDHPPITIDDLKPYNVCQKIGYPGNPYAGKCTFTLAPHTSKIFPLIPGKCMSGAIAFGDYPQCPSTAYPTGINQAEFTLNTSNPGVYPEALDISMVNGFNAYITIAMTGGGVWTYGNAQPISHIGPNRGLHQNAGLPGIFPYGCTDCIRAISPPCPPPVGPCQPTRICNAQRYGGGGTVEITVLDGPQ